MIIGSVAMKYHFEDFKRYPKDIDFVGKSSDYGSNRTIDGKRCEYLENPILEKYFPDSEYLNPNALLTLKMSHIFWDINWDKHMYDIQFMLKKGIKYDLNLFYELYDYWNEYHGKNKRSDLKMTASEFFDNAVACPYDHDFLHTLLAPVPAYTKVLKDGEEVDVSEYKFNTLPDKDKKALVQEEVMVMAYERFKKLHYKVAYSRMLKKFLMNHAPMWEALYIIENYVDLDTAPFNYFKHIDDQVANM